MFTRYPIHYSEARMIEFGLRDSVRHRRRGADHREGETSATQIQEAEPADTGFADAFRRYWNRESARTANITVKAERRVWISPDLVTTARVFAFWMPICLNNATT